MPPGGHEHPVFLLGIFDSITQGFKFVAELIPLLFKPSQ